MKHRVVPYINALLMSLMGSHVSGEELNPEYKRGRGSGGHQLLSYAQVHVIDAELVDSPHDEARQKIQNLPFVHTHSMHHHGWYDSLLLPNHDVTSRKLEMIQQYLMAARVCQQSGLDWCLMMEEYTIVPLNFVLKLKRFITAPWQTYSHVQGNNGDSSHEVLAKTFSSISLFSSVNKDSNAPMMPHNVEYSQETYNRDRAKLNSERFTMKHEHKHHDDYELKQVPKGEDGTNVAMLFTNHVTTTQLIPMLEELYKAERNELLVKAIFKWTGDYTEESKPPEETYAYFDLERELALYMGVPRFRTEPSLVNRIGFYDEYYPGSWNNKDSTTTNSYDDTIGITNWLTDPRFLFDAGSYWDDSVEYCLDANSTWIFDPYFDDETQSCCNPESDCAIERKNKNGGSED